ncbi:MAG: FkbM family methyltransferase [Promethearchaeota archaeon]
MNNEIIFDLGFHNGDDTNFYLKKGFKVVALEANQELVKRGLERFYDYIDEKRLILINKAISDKIGMINFYIHPKKSDWSSCDQKMAESDGTKSKVISVESVSLIDLCKEFGTPRYIKVDVEGCEIMVAKQLFSLNVKPQFISFETSKTNYAGIFSWLYVSGYKRFQLVNQLIHLNRKPEDNQNQTEGKKLEFQFSKYSSGFFGNDLPKDKWLRYDEALTRYIKYKELKYLDNQELALGWLDVHASL